MGRSFANVLAEVEKDSADRRFLNRLKRAGVDSVSKLADAAERPAGDASMFYVWLLGRCGGARAETSLLRILTGPRRSLWMQAAASLSIMGTSRVVPALIRILAQDHYVRRREASVYALGFIDPGTRAVAVINTLVTIVSSADAPRVRAQAAESVTQLLRFHRGPVRRASEDVLIAHLLDHSPDVRFWCAYAVGELRVKRATPGLRRLAKDRSDMIGWWSVGVEARDALRVIDGGTWPDRSRNAP
jgi:HEAT repeat protein